jgi:hypothetical protein
MKTLDQHFSTFLQERKWLKNITPKSVIWYETFWKAFQRLLPEVTDTSHVTKQTLQTFVVRARDATKQYMESVWETTRATHTTGIRRDSRSGRARGCWRLCVARRTAIPSGLPLTSLRAKMSRHKGPL